MKFLVGLEEITLQIAVKLKYFEWFAPQEPKLQNVKFTSFIKRLASGPSVVFTPVLWPSRATTWRPGWELIVQSGSGILSRSLTDMPTLGVWVCEHKSPRDAVSRLFERYTPGSWTPELRGLDCETVYKCIRVHPHTSLPVLSHRHPKIPAWRVIWPCPGDPAITKSAQINYTS